MDQVQQRIELPRLYAAVGRSFIIAAAMVAILAACGGGGDGDQGSSTEVAASEQTADASGGDSELAEPSSPELSPSEASSATSNIDVTVTSDDGVLEVFVPAQSGPAEITIEPLDLTDPEVQAIGYELGPDGAKFSEPVTLTFSLPAGDWAADDGVPLLTFASDSEDVPPATVSRDGDTVTVTADITHFSSFVVVNDGAGVFTLLPDLVGVPADGSAQVGVGGSVFASEGSDLRVQDREFLEVTWSVDDPSFTVTPAAAPGRRPSANVSCTNIGGRTSVRVEFDLFAAANERPFLAAHLLFAGVRTFVELDGEAVCVKPAAPYESPVTGAPEGIPEITGALLSESSDGGLNLAFFTAAEASLTTPYQAGVVFDATDAAGNPIFVECPNPASSVCLFFDPSLLSSEADFTTEIPEPGGLNFLDVDLAVDSDGVLSFLVPPGAPLEAGLLLELTRVGAFITTSDGSLKEWSWDPADLAATLVD